MKDQKQKQEDPEHAPVRQSVHVNCPIDDAFRLFTERFGEWWPNGAGESDVRELGTVTIWDPPRRVAFTWNSNEDESVDVVFSPDGDGTRVTLTHHGWQKSGVEMACMAGSFAEFATQGQMAMA